MKLLVVLFTTFVIGGEQYPAEVIVGDKYAPLVMPNIEICRRQAKSYRKSKPDNLPPVKVQCRKVFKIHLPQKIKWFSRTKHKI